MPDIKVCKPDNISPIMLHSVIDVRSHLVTATPHDIVVRKNVRMSDTSKLVSQQVEEVLSISIHSLHTNRI